MLARNSLLNVGEGGEEYARMMLSMATDFTVSSTKRFNTPTDTIINLWDWLVTLFGTSNSAKISSRFSRQRRSENAEFQSWAENHWLNYTHYMRLERQFQSSNSAPHALLIQAWTRQVGLLGVSNQKDWDIIIPILYFPRHAKPTMSATFVAGDLTSLAIQIKNSSPYTKTMGYPKNYGDCFAMPVKPREGSRHRMNMIFNLRAATGFEHHLLTDTESQKKTHCLYIGGSGPDTFGIHHSLTDNAKQQIHSVLGILERNQVGRDITVKAMQGHNGYMVMDMKE